MRHRGFRLCDPRSMGWAFSRTCAAFVALAASCSATDLEHRIDALVEATAGKAGARPFGIAGIHVVDVSTGETLYRHNENLLLLPASNFKLLTTALALERLGPGYRFTTRLVREPSGDLVLVGGGDPSLSGREYPYRKNGAPANGAPATSAMPRSAMQAMDELAAQVAAHGVTKIDGDIVGDDRAYPWEPYPPSWTQDDTLRGYGAPVSALSLNDNLVAVALQPGRRAGDPTQLTISPAFEYLTVDNRVVTGARGGEPGIHLEHAPGSRHWTITGSVPAGQAAVTETIPVDDPALFAAAALHDALTRRGILVQGKAIARHRPATAAYAALEGEEIASRLSPPLTELLQVMDKLSLNLHSELMLREVGRVKHGDGTTRNGLAEMAALLAEIGVSPGDWKAEDGSGLSRNDLVTARLLTNVLVHQWRKFGDAFVSLLPVGGEDGTLDARLCCIGAGRAVQAKTGTLARASALSGYADVGAKGRYAFSILVNDFAAPAATVREWIDKIATALLE